MPAPRPGQRRNLPPDSAGEGPRPS
jgi:hypothetical protein